MSTVGKTAIRSLRVSIILLIAISAAAHSADGQEPVYRPTVGKTYDYGIEYRVAENSTSSRSPGQAFHRCRLRYTITAADEAGWTADYVTIPLLRGGSTSAHEFEQCLKRLREQAEGNGFLDFSTDLGMPYSGSIDLQTENLRFVGNSAKNTVRIGFHFLHGWRSTSFDYNLLPIPEALSPEILPRMTAKQQSTLKRYWGSDETEPRLDLFAQNCAPPPYDSSFQKAIDEMLAERDELPKRISGPRQYHFDTMDRLTQRWDEIRWLATLLPRKWSDKSGAFSIEARLVSRDGESVTLLRQDNEKQVTLPIDQLSEVDAEFARTFGKPPSGN